MFRTQSKFFRQTRHLLSKKETKSSLERVNSNIDTDLPESQKSLINEPPERPKFITFTAGTEGEYLFNSQKLKQVTFNTTDGKMSIHPGHMMNVYKLAPGAVEIEFPNGIKDKYYCVGGFIFNSIMGPVHMNTGEMYHLDDLDLSRVQSDISKYQAQLKARDPKEQVEACIALEALEPLEKELEARE
eukprot:gene282-6697_t